MTKYNRSEIMRNANGYAKTMSRSDALRKAWAEAKSAELNRAWSEVKAAAAGTLVSWTDIETAFKAKYPTGTITKGTMFSFSAKVQFSPNGKTYFYKVRGYELMKRLGIAA